MSNFVDRNCPGRKACSDVRTELMEGRGMRDRVIAEENQKSVEERVGLSD